MPVYCPCLPFRSNLTLWSYGLSWQAERAQASRLPGMLTRILPARRPTLRTARQKDFLPDLSSGACRGAQTASLKCKAHVLKVKWSRALRAQSGPICAHGEVRKLNRAGEIDQLVHLKVGHGFLIV